MFVEYTHLLPVYVQIFFSGKQIRIVLKMENWEPPAKKTKLSFLTEKTKDEDDPWCEEITEEEIQIVTQLEENASKFNSVQKIYQSRNQVLVQTIKFGKLHISKHNNLDAEDTDTEEFESDEHVTKQPKLNDEEDESLEKRKEMKLSLMTPGGKPSTHDIISSFNTLKEQHELSILNPCSCESSPELPEEWIFPLSNLDLIRESIESEDMWNYFDNFLSQHISFLQDFENYVQNKSDLTANDSDEDSSIFELTPVSSSNVNDQHRAFRQCLELLTKVFDKNYPKRKTSLDNEICIFSAPLFGTMNEIIERPPCLVSLLTLTNEETYPKEYEYKKEEMYQCLYLILHWSIRSPNSIIQPAMYYLPLKPLLNAQYGFSFTLTTLQILNNLVSVQYFEKLLHRTESCPLIIIARMCHIMFGASHEEYASILKEISSFIYSALAYLGNEVLNFRCCPCSSEVIQGFILMLNEYYDLCDRTSSWDNIDVIEYGIMTLHQISIVINHAQRKRYPVESTYQVLMRKLLRLASENNAIKVLSDSIEELVDFEDICTNSKANGGGNDSDSLFLSDTFEHLINE